MNPNEPIETKEELPRLLQSRLDDLHSAPVIDPSELVDLAPEKAALIEFEIEYARVGAVQALDIAMEAIGRLGLDRPNPFPTYPASLSEAKHTLFNLITFFSNGDKGKVTAETPAPAKTSEDAPPLDLTDAQLMRIAATSDALSELSLDTRACALYVKKRKAGENPTKASLAREGFGLPKQSLAKGRCPNLDLLMQRDKAEAQADIPRGSKSFGTIEAVDSDDDADSDEDR